MPLGCQSDRVLLVLPPKVALAFLLLLATADTSPKDICEFSRRLS